MKTTPYWFNRYFSPWSDECNSFYETHKFQISIMKKEMDWENGIRLVTFTIGNINKTFIENF